MKRWNRSLAAVALSAAVLSIGLSTPAMAQDADTIMRVQQELNNRGYDAGEPDGRIGQQTRDAIAAFQTNSGMDPTGNLDQTTIGRLLTGSLQQSRPTPPAGSSAVASDPTPTAVPTVGVDQEEIALPEGAVAAPEPVRMPVTGIAWLDRLLRGDPLAVWTALGVGLLLLAVLTVAGRRKPRRSRDNPFLDGGNAAPGRRGDPAAAPPLARTRAETAAPKRPTLGPAGPRPGPDRR